MTDNALPDFTIETTVKKAYSWWVRDMSKPYSRLSPNGDSDRSIIEAAGFRPATAEDKLAAGLPISSDWIAAVRRALSIATGDDILDSIKSLVCLRSRAEARAKQAEYLSSMVQHEKNELSSRLTLVLVELGQLKTELDAAKKIKDYEREMRDDAEHERDEYRAKFEAADAVIQQCINAGIVVDMRAATQGTVVVTKKQILDEIDLLNADPNSAIFRAGDYNVGSGAYVDIRQANARISSLEAQNSDLRARLRAAGKQ